MTSPEERIRESIRDFGPIPFATFMEEALYGNGGYYTKPSLPIGPGPECDFATAPSMSPLFGGATARLLTTLDAELGAQAAILEAGPGNGDHLAALLLHRRRPAIAWDRVVRQLPDGVRQIEDLNSIAAASVEGLIFSCELFDALPVHRLIGLEGDEIGELRVDLGEGDEFVWRVGALSEPALLDRLGDQVLEPGQVADVAPGAVPLYRELAKRLGRGYLVTCDYGYERPALFDARIRRNGTLACHRRHRVHRNPFIMVGDQDLTSWVDFTTLRESGEALGLQTVGLFRMAEWLVRLGIFDQLGSADLRTRRGALRLLDPEGMGHDQKVLVQVRGVTPPASLTGEVRTG